MTAMHVGSRVSRDFIFEYSTVREAVTLPDPSCHMSDDSDSGVSSVGDPTEFEFEHIDRHTKLADGIVAIVDEVAAREIPPIVASGQQSLEMASAADILLWLQKYDHVEITSYIAQQWHLFRSAAPRRINKSEESLYADWIDNSYYRHLETYYRTRSCTLKYRDCLMSFFGLPDSDCQMQALITEFATSLTSFSFEAFLNCVDGAFEAVIAKVPMCIRHEQERLRQAWLTESSVELMRSFSAKHRGAWQPEVDPDSLPCEVGRARAHRLVMLARDCNMHNFSELVDIATHDAYNSLPSFVREGVPRSEFRMKFLAHRYYAILEQFFSSRDLVTSEAVL